MEQLGQGGLHLLYVHQCLVQIEKKEHDGKGGPSDAVLDVDSAVGGLEELVKANHQDLCSFFFLPYAFQHAVFYPLCQLHSPLDRREDVDALKGKQFLSMCGDGPVKRGTLGRKAECDRFTLDLDRRRTVADQSLLSLFFIALVLDDDCFSRGTTRVCPNACALNYGALIWASV